MFCYVVLLSSFVKAEVVAHGNLYVNKLATFDSNHGIMNVRAVQKTYLLI